MAAYPNAHILRTSVQQLTGRRVVTTQPTKPSHARAPVRTHVTCVCVRPRMSARQTRRAWQKFALRCNDNIRCTYVFDLHIICAFVCQSSCRQNIYSPKPPRPHSPAMPPVFIPSSGWRHHRRHHQQQTHNAYAINTRGLTKLTSAESALM